MKSILYVLKRPAYLCCAIGGMMVGYGIISFSIHVSLIASLLGSFHGTQTLFVILRIILLGTYSVGGWIAVATSIGISLLWGVTIALSVYYMRHAKTVHVVASSGIRGIIALIGGVLGAGCWACGGVFLAPLLSMVAGGVSMTLLYIGGITLSLISFALLLYSLYTLARVIKKLPPHHI